MAISIFQRKLERDHPEYQAINLAYSGHNIYDLWIRLSYFEQIYQPAYVMMVMRYTAKDLFMNLQGPLSFYPKKDLGMRDERFLTKVKLAFRNSSSFLNLLAHGYLALGVRENLKELEQNQAAHASKEVIIHENYLQTLYHFQKKYQDKFIFISIESKDKFNSTLKDYCDRHGIQFSLKAIHHPKYLIRGVGHLDKEGHSVMGELIYETFNKYTR